MARMVASSFVATAGAAGLLVGIASAAGEDAEALRPSHYKKWRNNPKVRRAIYILVGPELGVDSTTYKPTNVVVRFFSLVSLFGGPTTTTVQASAIPLVPCTAAVRA